eukprot:EG_transcript_34922
MDPTLTASNVFATKGTMNHQESGAWRELIGRETKTCKQWKEKYSRSTLELETKMLLDSLNTEKQKKHQQAIDRQSPKQKILYEGISKEGAGRKAYLDHQHAIPPTMKSSYPQTAAQEIGWLAENTKYFESNEYGHRPVIEGSFYRKSGAF